VANEDNAAVTAIDVATRSVAFQVPVGKEPEGVAQSPDGQSLVVTSEDDNVVSWIDLPTRKVIATTETELRPRHVEFTADGKQLWIAAETGGVVQIADSASHAILETLHFAPPGVKDYQVLPCGIRFTPDGRTAVVALGRANMIALVDVSSRKVRAYVPVGKRVWHLAISADGTRAYTANGVSDDVTVVDLGTAKPVGTIAAGAGPWGWRSHPESPFGNPAWPDFAAPALSPARPPAGYGRWVAGRGRGLAPNSLRAFSDQRTRT
jgi:YVTN family beta-propeller protein